MLAAPPPLLQSLVPSMLGGCVLGLASAAVFAQGQILGVSGAVGGLLSPGGTAQPWRWGFLGGLLAGGAAAATVHPAAFPPFAATYSLARAVVGGALVGTGAALGGGCTSGHGVCGLSRLSARSAVFIGVAMAAGWAAANLTSAAAAAPQAAAATAAVPPRLTILAAALLGALLVVPAAAAAATKDRPGGRKTLQTGLWSGAGFVFALGLAVSGMTSAAKVVAFLSGPSSEAFDPSLAAVMAGAVGVAVLPFQTVHRWSRLRQAGAVNPDPRPPPANITPRLLVGGLLFGTGWGATGLCPGPALVSLARPSMQGFAAVGAMLVGMAAVRRLAP